MNSWEYVSSKLGSVKDETLEIAKELYDVARANGHEIWFMWGMGTSYEHRSGLALDLMVRNQDAGDFIRDYIWRNRARLRLRHVIWWQQITSTIVSPGVVREMADRGNTTKNHMDHIHVWFYAGSYRAPEQSASTQVKSIQKVLEVKSDGKWGPNTDARALLMRTAARSKRGWPRSTGQSFNIRLVQRVIDTRDDGIWGPLSQASMVAWIKDMQKVIGVTVDGWWGHVTDEKFLTLRKKNLNNY